MSANKDVEQINAHSGRSIREIEHGKRLAESDPENIWGWGTQAGKKRAERRGAQIISAANITADQKTLEIGCGTGIFTEIFSRTGAEIIAVDISPELISMAENRRMASSKVQFLCVRFEDYEADELFDTVVGSSVLHHIELDSALKNIFRLLKPGGRIVFAEPNFLNPQVFAMMTFLRNFLSGVSHDETAFIRWSLSKTLMEIGFEEIRITPTGWLHPYTPAKLINIVSKVEFLLERIPLINEFSGSLLIKAKKPLEE